MERPVIADSKAQEHSTLEVTIHDAPQFVEPYSQIFHEDRKSNTERRICRPRITTFWLILALVFVLLLAVIGGSIGGVLASRDSSQKATDSLGSLSSTTSIASGTSSSSSMSVTTPSPTNTPSSTTIPSNECPSSNNTEFTAPLTSSVFRITCGVDWNTGLMAADGNGTVQDIVGIYSDSIEECIDGCASYNYNGGGTLCMAVSYTANLSESWVSAQHANCFLKNKAGFSKTIDSVTCAQMISV